MVGLGIPGQDVDLQHLTDEALSALVKEDSEAAFCELLARYLPFIRKKAGAYGWAGLEPDDLSQEASMGLLSAAKATIRTPGPPFVPMRRSAWNADFFRLIKLRPGKKHIPLNQYVSLNDSAGGQNAGIDLPSDRMADPEELLIGREDLERMERRIEETLSGLEKNVLSYYLGGASYEEIARALHISEKAVDNALQRVRCKLRKTVS